MNIPIVGEVNISKNWNIIIALLALLYIVSPVDLLPEVILGPIGLIDDAIVFLIGVAPLFASFIGEQNE